MIEHVHQICRSFAARDAADPEAYPRANVADLFEAGVISAPFPVAHGGRDLSLADAARIVEAVAAASPSTALLLTMPLGLAGVLAGTRSAAPPDRQAAQDAQVERVATDFRDRKIYAACNSERGAGGSLAATKTIVRSGDRGGFELDGEKILASFGESADYFFSTAKLSDGSVEFFILDAHGPGVEIRTDWNGFGMRSTESHSVRLANAKAREQLGWPGFLASTRPTSWWWCLFAAIPLGCAASVLRALGTPTPQSPALRLRCAEALMRLESLRAYLHDTASRWRPAAPDALDLRMLRTKTWVSQESARLAAELFALSGGKHYTRTSAVAGALADAFAGTALRPPLPLALETLSDRFSADALDEP